MSESRGSTRAGIGIQRGLGTPFRIVSDCYRHLVTFGLKELWRRDGSVWAPGAMDGATGTSGPHELWVARPGSGAVWRRESRTKRPRFTSGSNEFDTFTALSLLPFLS